MTDSRARTNLTLLATLTLGLGVVAVIQTSGESATAGEQEVRDAASMSPRALLAGRSDGEGPCSFAPGARMAYEVTTRSHNRIDMGPLMEGVRVQGAELNAKPTQMDQQAERRWHVDLEAIARAEDGSTVLAARIDAEPTRVGDQGTQPPLPELGDTFLVRLDPRCRIDEFGWRSDGELDAARDQQRLLTGLSWLAPRDGEPSYAGTLVGPMGRYHAGFTVGDRAVTGRVVDMREPFGTVAGQEPPAFEVLASSIEVVPAAGEWLGSLSSSRTVRMSMYGIPMGEVESTVSARHAEPGDFRPEVSLDDGGWTWGLLLGTSKGADVDDRVVRELVGVPAREAVDRYLAQVGEGVNSAKAARQLAEWLRANPEGAGELVAMLRAGAFDEDALASSGVFMALAKADTPQATAALVGIVQGEGDRGAHKVSAAHALSMVSSPTAAMVDVIVAQTQRTDLDPSTRGSLAMTLGAFAKRHAARDPELAAMAREEIAGWLAAPADERALTDSLLAAGNAGHDELAPAIEPYLEHADPEVRRWASYSMRHMSPQEAYPRLSTRLGDDDATVRASAIETMTRVSRNHDVAPPEAVVDVAIEQLDMEAPQREHKALLALLGEASRRGNEGAQAVLRQHLDDELSTGAPDVDKLRALGRHTNVRWTAE